MGKTGYITCYSYLGRPFLLQRIDLDCSISDCKLLGILVVMVISQELGQGNRTHCRPLECHQIMTLSYFHGLWVVIPALLTQEDWVAHLHQYHYSNKNRLNFLSDMRRFFPVKHESLSKWGNTNWKQKKKKKKNFFHIRKRQLWVIWVQLNVIWCI